MAETEQADEFDRMYQQTLKNITDGMKSLPALKGQNRLDKVAELDRHFKSAKRDLRSFKLELNDVSTRDVKLKYESRHKQYFGELGKLEEDFKFQKTAQDRDELLSGASDPLANPGGASAKDTIEQAKKIQAADQSAMGRMKAQVAETTEIGTETAAKLHGQTEQMSKIGEQMDELDGLLRSAKQQLRVLMRRMMTDKVILFFLFIIVCGIIGIIVIHVVEGEDSQMNVPDEVVPAVNGEDIDNAEQTMNSAANDASDAVGRRLLLWQRP